MIPRLKRAPTGTGEQRPPIMLLPPAELNVPDALVQIREVLQPRMADLAKVIGVSRQAIYKWASGDAAPEEPHRQFISRLADLTDQMSRSGVSRPDLVVQRIVNQNPLWVEFAVGRVNSAFVEEVIREAKTAADAYVAAGLSTRGTKTTEDWRSYISIPGDFE